MAHLSLVRIPRARPGGRRAGLALPDSGTPYAGRRPGLLVLHELIGLDASLREICRRLADLGYVVLAPDLLDEGGPGIVCMARLMAGVGRGHGGPYAELERAREWLAGREDVDAERIGVVGFCIGGGFAILYAASAGVRVVAPFYGAVPRDVRALRGICPTVASYGGRDRVFGHHGGRLEHALQDLGVEHDVKTYPEAGHGFMARRTGVLAALGPLLPMRDRYEPGAAEDAWRRLEAFLARHLAAPDPSVGVAHASSPRTSGR